MTRINHTLPFIALAIMLASTGCGDAGSFDETASEDTSRVADDTVSTDDTTLTLEDELELACEGFCDTAASCRHAVAGENCAERCATEYRSEADDACVAAQIELVNCYAGTICGPSDELRIECGTAILALRSECDPSGLRRELEEDGMIEVVEVRELEPADVDGDPEEAEPSEESGDEEPGEPEDSDPVFELPEIPDYPDFPEIGPVIDFP